jgi:methylenetetrahydrofolate dehydrogenase (NAD+)
VRHSTGSSTNTNKRPFSRLQSAAIANAYTSESRIVDVSSLADQMRLEVRNYAQNAATPLRLAGIFATDAMAESQRLEAELYASQIYQTLQEDGIVYEHVECRGEQPQDIEAAIRAMNCRNDVTGILVYYPIFQHKHLPPDRRYLNASTGVYYKSYDDYLRDQLRPDKDVEGLGNEYNSRCQFRRRGSHKMEHMAMAERSVYVPCTALAVARILDTFHTFPSSSSPSSSWTNVTATVVNRSEILGRPLAAMLALKGATVYSVDENSILLFRNNGRTKRLDPRNANLEWCLQQSTIAVTGVPHPDFVLPLDALLDNQEHPVTVVNVSEFENVAQEEVLARSENISLIPQVGKVTVAALEHNLVRLHMQQQKQKRDANETRL